MNRKEKSAAAVNRIADVFRCPICNVSMKASDLKSLVCSNNHTFDFAKQGYLNMMTRPSKSQYNKSLFEARQKIIMESNLYAPVHEKIAEMIQAHINSSHDPKFMLDAGCGEGSHMQRILDECDNKAITAIGLDISKEGVLEAAKHYPTSVWLVGDLANIPLADRSHDIVLNILSPANYDEFKRILAVNGLVIKVVPRSGYLKELRETLFTSDENKNTYDNSEVVTLFEQHFNLIDTSSLTYFKELSQQELLNLIQMSPLGWNSTEEETHAFINEGPSGITVDLDILIGITKRTKNENMT